MKKKKKKSKENTQWPPKSNNKNLAALMLTAMSVGCGVVNTSRIGISSSTTKENEIRGKLSLQGSSATSNDRFLGTVFVLICGRSYE